MKVCLCNIFTFITFITLLYLYYAWKNAYEWMQAWYVFFTDFPVCVKLCIYLQRVCQHLEIHSIVSRALYHMVWHWHMTLCLFKIFPKKVATNVPFFKVIMYYVIIFVWLDSSWSLQLRYCNECTVGKSLKQIGINIICITLVYNCGFVVCQDCCRKNIRWHIVWLYTSIICPVIQILFRIYRQITIGILVLLS